MRAKDKASAAHARRPTLALGMRRDRPWPAVAVRFATSWLVTLALLLQIALSAAPLPGAGSLDVLASAGICHSIDTSAPADSQDRVVVHFKCIACVLVCSLPPPSLVVTAAPSLSWVWLTQRWPLTEAAPRSVPASSHSARGPPDLA
ncbi:hypothetical protein [Rhodopseudomonas sp. BR0M22]|uniref:hypothetical protein n=1 Tax=Rhodopseudomonas sp. BR0M22 TaxID=2269369 RepID=UPI001E50D82E|nr:hypothetical protein [Rhodopseudomonas sp. BR0M22]MCD0419279.1 hypothetical protein [Rubrivivax sp. JA1024]